MWTKTYTSTSSHLAYTLYGGRTPGTVRTVRPSSSFVMKANALELPCFKSSNVGARPYRSNSDTSANVLRKSFPASLVRTLRRNTSCVVLTKCSCSTDRTIALTHAESKLPIPYQPATPNIERVKLLIKLMVSVWKNLSVTQHQMPCQSTPRGCQNHPTGRILTGTPKRFRQSLISGSQRPSIVPYDNGHDGGPTQ